MIRLKKAMPTITADFLKGVVYCAENKLQYFSKYPISKLPPADTRRDEHDQWYFRQREVEVKNHEQAVLNRAATIKYLVPIARKEKPALDLLLSRLRKLDYDRFELIYKTDENSIEEAEFVCTTVPLTMVDVNHRIRTWEIGQYNVVVPVYGLINASLQVFKMVPIQERLPMPGIGWPFSIGYHPHHTSGNTCWADWAYPVTEACRNANFDMLFGAFIMFLKHYNSHSPLSNPPDNDYTHAPLGTDDWGITLPYVSPRQYPLFWMKPYVSGKPASEGRRR
jgi:hypothetical protein